jgi:hypothetical protein
LVEQVIPEWGASFFANLRDLDRTGLHGATSGHTATVSVLSGSRKRLYDQERSFESSSAAFSRCPFASVRLVTKQWLIRLLERAISPALKAKSAANFFVWPNCKYSMDNADLVLDALGLSEAALASQSTASVATVLRPRTEPGW